MVELESLGVGERDHLDRAGGGRLVAGAQLDAGVGDGAQVADEVAGRALRLAPGPGRGQLGQAREAEQPLGGLGLGGEEALAAQADPLDQPPHEDVGAALLERRRGCPVELEEALDPLARLGLDLRALERRLAGGDHVELAPPRDRRQPREVDRAQLDRRPGQRPRRGGRVVGVGEHPQPGDRVADLGAAEERRRARRGGRGCCAPPSPPRRRRRGGPARRRSRRSAPAAPRRRSGARPRAPPPAPGRARCGQRQKRTGDLGRRLGAARLLQPLGDRGDDRARRVGDLAATAEGAVEDDHVGIGVKVAEPGGGTRRRRRGVAWSSSRAQSRLALSAASSASTPSGRGWRPRARRPSRERKRAAISRRTSARSASSRRRTRMTSPESRLPPAARIRSWAA